MPGIRTIKDGAAWIASQQGKHSCQCGCGQAITIKIHHNARGVPRFINGHAIRVDGHPLRSRSGNRNGRWKGGNYVRGSEQSRQFLREYQRVNKDRLNRQRREWRRRTDSAEKRQAKAAKKKQAYDTNPVPFKAAIKRYHMKHNDKVRAGMKAQRDRLRQAMLDAYGNACECCGETCREFLTLAHLLNNGALERKQFGHYGVLKRLRDLGWPKDGYALQCANCNWATRYGAACPHKQTVLALVS